jgi:hypothetical protein
VADSGRRLPLGRSRVIGLRLRKPAACGGRVHPVHRCPAAATTTDPAPSSSAAPPPSSSAGADTQAATACAFVGPRLVRNRHRSERIDLQGLGGEVSGSTARVVEKFHKKIAGKQPAESNEPVTDGVEGWQCASGPPAAQGGSTCSKDDKTTFAAAVPNE